MFTKNELVTIEVALELRIDGVKKTIENIESDEYVDEMAIDILKS